MNILNKIYNLKNHNSPSYQLKKLKERHKRYCFTDLKCNSKEQYRASITRLYHTIEKGLAYENYRAGFGADNVNKLIETLSQFSRKYNIDEFCYRTALDCLYKYIAKNKE